MLTYLNFRVFLKESGSYSKRETASSTALETALTLWLKCGRLRRAYLVWSLLFLSITARCTLHSKIRKLRGGERSVDFPSS
jgi:hypothetical protein